MSAQGASARGFFDTEFFVTVQGSAVYVNAGQVKFETAPQQGSEVPGQVLAYLIEESPGKALVELSGEAAVGGLRTWVPSEELSAA